MTRPNQALDPTAGSVVDFPLADFPWFWSDLRSAVPAVGQLSRSA